MIQMTKEAYNQLMERSDKLSALEAVGVEAWEYYETAMRLLAKGCVSRFDNIPFGVRA